MAQREIKQWSPYNAAGQYVLAIEGELIYPKNPCTLPL